MITLLWATHRYIKEKLLELRPAKKGIEVTYVVSIHYAGSTKHNARNIEAHFTSIAPKNEQILKLIADKIKTIMRDYLSEQGYSEEDMPMDFGFDYAEAVKQGKEIDLKPDEDIPSAIEIYDYDYGKERYPKRTNLPFGWWRLKPEDILRYF